MTTASIGNHVEQALARVIEEYKKAPKLRSIVTALTTQIQGAESAFNSVRIARTIVGASGISLDRIGEIVGVERPFGLVDSVYRIMIYGKAAANSSAGTPEDLINTFALLTNGTDVRIEEIFPAKINIFSNGTIADEALEYVIYYFKESMPAGVMLGTYGLTDDESEGFGFLENPGALGFGDLDNPLVGGGLGSLLG